MALAPCIYRCVVVSLYPFLVVAIFRNHLSMFVSDNQKDWMNFCRLSCLHTEHHLRLQLGIPRPIFCTPENLDYRQM